MEMVRALFQVVEFDLLHILSKSRETRLIALLLVSCHLWTYIFKTVKLTLMVLLLVFDTCRCSQIGALNINLYPPFSMYIKGLQRIQCEKGFDIYG